MEETDEHGNVVQRVGLPCNPKQPNQLFASHVFHYLLPLHLSELVQTRPPNVPSRCSTCAWPMVLALGHPGRLMTRTISPPLTSYGGFRRSIATGLYRYNPPGRTRLKSAIPYCTTFCYIAQWPDGTVTIWLPATY